MKDKVFFDSNIIIYAYSLDDLDKKKLVEQLANSHAHILISTQTINEFVNVMFKKKKISYQEILSTIAQISENCLVTMIDQDSIKKAISIAIEFHYSYFDSLMIASAIINDCSVLYTEDMHNQHKIENLKIINPFK